jgi:hypothetical protein
MIAFIPSTILFESSSLPYDISSYQGYPLQYSEDLYLLLDVRNEKFVSLYIMTIEESSRLIEGTPIENVSTVFSLVNISEYSGLVGLGTPGLFVLFVTTFNQSESAMENEYLDFELFVTRRVPHYSVLSAGLIFFALALIVRYFPFVRGFRLLREQKM